MMCLLSLVPAVSPVALALETELDKIVRTYSPNESFAYQLNIDVPAQKEHLTAKISFAVTKTSQAGATVNLKVSDATGTDGTGKTSPLPPVTPVDYAFGANGLSDQMSMKGDGFPFALFGFASYAPGDISKSKAFNINWASTDKSISLKGNGSYEGLQTIDGKSAAELKTSMNLQADPTHSIEIKEVTYLDPASGALIKADGTLNLMGVAATISLKRV